jgi:RNA polymerase sigma factor (sigma-70 family)
MHRGEDQKSRDLIAQARALRALALTLVRDEHRADDLVQDALVVALEDKGIVRKSVTAWLRGVVRNLARHQARTSRRREAREQRTIASAVVDPSEVASRIEVQQRLLGAVRDLPEPYRATIFARYFDGSSPDEIARDRGVPASTVRTWTQRGISRLRERLDRESRGRRAWTLALVPLLGHPEIGGAAQVAGTATTFAKGVVLMSAKKGLVAAAVLVMLASLAAVGIWLSIPPDRPGNGGGIARDGTVGPVVAEDNSNADAIAGKRAAGLMVSVRTVTNAPVPGARIEVVSTPNVLDIHDWKAIRVGLARPREPSRVATTDEHGLVLLSDLDAGTWIVSARAPGHPPAGQPVALAEGAVREVVLHLAPACALSGRVLDGERRPLSGARVVAVPSSTLSNPGHHPLRSEVATDDAGCFCFAALAAGKHVLSVSAGNGPLVPLERVRLPLAGPIDLVLSTGGRMWGIVRDWRTGEPVAGVTVHALCVARFGHADAESTTDEGGRYELAPLPTAFVQQIRAETPTCRTVTDSTGHLSVRLGESIRCDLKVAPAVWLTGRVLGPTGDPLPGAEVRCHSLVAPVSVECRVVRTDADGVYRMACLPCARIAVEARFPAHVQPGAPAQMGRALLAGLVPEMYLAHLPVQGEAERDVRLVLGLALRGRTVDAEGSPLPGVRVTASGPRGLSSTSDGEGTFRLAGLPPGDVRLRARKAGWCPEENGSVHLDVDRPIEPVVIRLLPSPFVEGRVTAETGEPLPGAWVRVQTHHHWSHVLGAANRRGTPTDPDGRYRLPLPRPTGSYAVLAGAPGRALTLSEPFAVEGAVSVHTVDLALGPWYQLEGRVLDAASGLPLAGARVSIAPAGTFRVSSFQVGDLIAVSDGAGRFQLEQLPDGRIDVHVEADLFLDRTLTVEPRAASSLTIELSPARRITGTVVFETGRPAERVELTISRVNEAGVSRPMYSRDASSVSTGDGGFSFDGLVEGDYEIRIRGGTGPRRDLLGEASGTIPAGSNGIRLVVRKGGSIEGTVIGPDGRPVGMATVVAATNSGPASWHCLSLPDGTFRVGGLAPGRYTILVQAGATVLPWRQEGVQCGTSSLRAVLEQAHAIEGVIVDGKDRPVRNANLLCVQIRTSSSGARRSGREVFSWTDGLGRFHVGGLAAGPHRITVMSPERMELKGGEEIQAGTSNHRLVARVGTVVSGRVLDDSGNPMAGAWVRAEDGFRERLGLTVWTRQDGGFALKGVSQGKTYKITVGAEGWAQMHRDGVSTGTKDLMFRLTRARKVAGIVKDAAGKPLAGVVVILRHVKGIAEGSDRTDEEGRFVVVGLHPGSYSIRGLWLKKWWDLGAVEAGSDGVVLRLAD